MVRWECVHFPGCERIARLTKMALDHNYYTIIIPSAHYNWLSWCFNRAPAHLGHRIIQICLDRPVIALYSPRTLTQTVLCRPFRGLILVQTSEVGRKSLSKPIFDSLPCFRCLSQRDNYVRIERSLRPCRSHIRVFVLACLCDDSRMLWTHQAH